MSSFTTPSPAFLVEHCESGDRIDVCETTFIDSSGLHVLLDVHRRRQGRLTIDCPPGNVRRVLDLTGVARSSRTLDA